MALLYSCLVLLLQATVDCSQQMLFETLVRDVSNTPQWNPTVADAKIIQVIDDSTDIHYTVAAEFAAGLVSSRSVSRHCTVAA